MFIYTNDFFDHEWVHKEDKSILELELPRYRKEDIDIEISDSDILAIQLKGSKEYRYKLSKDLDIKKTTASLEYGVLTLEVPRVEQKTTKIEISNVIIT